SRDLKLQIVGAGFRSDMSVSLGAGIDVTSKEFVDAQHVNAFVTVARAAEMGKRTLTVSAGGQTANLDSIFTIGDDVPPTAKFTITPATGTINTTFVLDASGSTDTDGHITSYQWTFNDGDPIKGKRIEKQFADVGQISVKLTVSDDKQSLHTVEKKLDVADNAEPDASFTVTPSSGYTVTTFTFDASASVDPDGTIRSYNWEFGDGKKSTGKKTTHRFLDGGDYSVVLTVEDSSKVEKTATRKVKVTFFDVEKAKKEINDVCTGFLKLFDDMEVLSAEQIVVGFSHNCTGRAREIAIIEAEQPLVDNASVQLLGDTQIESATPTNARASLTARFYGTYVDGTDYDGVATHNFTMVNEDGEWKICNFSVIKGLQSESLQRLFPY
ncbi:PKD domain-containing protein, partial [bacterium]|nr:PKD domain-containing protein [bacterium]